MRVVFPTVCRLYSNPGEVFKLSLTRAQFEDMCSDLLERTLLPVYKVLDESGTKKEEINELVHTSEAPFPLPLFPHLLPLTPYRLPLFPYCKPLYLTTCLLIV